MVNFFNIDNIEFMKQKPDGYYDLAIVDPPYGVGISKWDSEIPPKEYFDQLFRVSKNQIIWGGNFFNLPPTRCYIVWNKKQWLKVRSTLEYAWTSFDDLPYYLEYTYCGNAEGLEKIKVDYTKKSIHPCQKPVNIYRILFEKYSTDNMKILDTHGGSMSIAIAADSFKIDLDITEIDEKYFNDGTKRYYDYKRQLKLF